jgi:hypothetical protein
MRCQVEGLILNLFGNILVMYGVGNNDCLPLQNKNGKSYGKTNFIFGFYVKKYIKKFISLIKRRWFGLQLQL